MPDDPIFRALADPSRRLLLDQLFERDGRSLKELEASLAMTRFGVMKHLHVLEEAGLVTTRKVGREKLHYLNPVPIQLLYDRWIGKYAAPRIAALADLKAALEMTAPEVTVLQGDTAMTVEAPASPKQVYQMFIKATPERVWEALTTPAFTERYFHGTRVQSDLTVGSPFNYLAPNDATIVEGQVLESDPPNRLVHTWRSLWDADVSADGPSRVTWELTGMSDGMTRLTVVHDQFDGETATFKQTSSGWSWILSNIKTLLETGEVLPNPS